MSLAVVGLFVELSVPKIRFYNNGDEVRRRWARYRRWLSYGDYFRITRLVAALLFTAPGLKFRFLGPAAAAGGRGVYVSERW